MNRIESYFNLKLEALLLDDKDVGGIGKTIIKLSDDIQRVHDIPHIVKDRFFREEDCRGLMVWFNVESKHPRVKGKRLLTSWLYEGKDKEGKSLYRLLGISKATQHNVLTYLALEDTKANVLPMMWFGKDRSLLGLCYLKQGYEVNRNDVHAFNRFLFQRQGQIEIVFQYAAIVLEEVT